MKEDWSGGTMGKLKVVTDGRYPGCNRKADSPDPAVQGVPAVQTKSVRFQLSSEDKYDQECAVKGAQVKRQVQTRPLKTNSTSSMGGNKKGVA